MERLRAKDASNLAEIEHFKTVNRTLCSILKGNNIPIPLGLDKSRNEHANDRAQVIDNTRPPERLQDTASRSVQTLSGPGTSAGRLLDLNDPQIAVGFVMDLEEPCLVTHLHYRGPDGETGHSMLLRNMVVENVQSVDNTLPTQQAPPTTTRAVSNTELRETLLRLLQAAHSLNMPGEMTPIQCWNTLRTNPAASRLTRQKFDEIKQAFISGIVCYG